MRWIAALVFMAALPAQAQVAREFAGIDAARIVSADLKVTETWPPSDLEETGEGDYVAKRSAGVKPLREEQRCALTPALIARSIDVLKHARPIAGEDNGIGADMVIFFKRPKGDQIVAVIGSPEVAGGDAKIFFDGRLAMLGAEGQAELKAVASEAGCEP